MKSTLILSTIAAMIAGAPLSAQETVVRETTKTVAPVEVTGIITELAPNGMIVRTEQATTPVRYTFTETTEYVNDAGTRVSREFMKMGLPVTIRYTKEGDRLIVNRVLVRKAVVPASVIEKTTTTTTTTTDEDDDDDDDVDDD